MKNIFLLLLALTLLGCSSTQKYNDEHMYDLASQFKDLSQSVDGTLKFGDLAVKDGDQILAAVMKEHPDKATLFANYAIKVELQGDNATLLLCDNDVALMEDAGCNAALDKIYWNNPTQHSCKITLDSMALCK